MTSGFKINKQAIRQMSREIEREFAKNPVRVPIETDPSSFAHPPAATVNNYHGSVVTVNGDHAQIAWGNDTVNQTQGRVEQVAPGYEELARLGTALLANLDALGLNDTDAVDVRTSAESVLAEIVKEEPDQGVVKRAVTMIKGLLASVATGASQEATQEFSESARHMIEALGNALPF